MRAGPRLARPTADVAAALSIPQRALSSDTDWEHAGITGATVTAMIVRGLVQRDPAGRLWPTKEGRARRWRAKDLIEPMTQRHALPRRAMLELPSQGDHER
jgi:hypothetical protein